jgi:hypothetical protein
MDADSAEGRATFGLAIHLLGECVEPVDLERVLTAMDSVLAERLADVLVKDIDFDDFDWSSHAPKPLE